MSPTKGTTYVFVSHAENIRMGCPVCIVELGLGHQLSTLLIYKRDCILGCDAQFIRPVPNEWTILLMQVCQIVWLFEGQILVDLPKIGDGGQERAREFGQRVEVALVYNVTD